MWGRGVNHAARCTCKAARCTRRGLQNSSRWRLTLRAGEPVARLHRRGRGHQVRRHTRRALDRRPRQACPHSPPALLASTPPALPARTPRPHSPPALPARTPRLHSRFRCLSCPPRSSGLQLSACLNRQVRALYWSRGEQGTRRPVALSTERVTARAPSAEIPECVGGPSQTKQKGAGPVGPAVRV